MKIGFTDNSYPNRRNIIGISGKHTYKKVHDLYKVIAAAAIVNSRYLKLPLGLQADAGYRFNDFGFNKVDLIHFFNTVSFGKTPWISTFETVIPRYRETLSCHHGINCGYVALKDNKTINIALEALSSEHCVQIIALSKCNLNMQAEMLSHFPSFESAIRNKLTQLNPPQAPLVSSKYEGDAPHDDKLRFIFVGNSFFCKGGREILSALTELRSKDGIDISLTIVSSMATDNYATHTDATDVKAALAVIEQNKEWIDYFAHLPNAEVLQLIRTADVGLLPSHADTYGYAVLEFQASACPVVTTNIRAFPEINNNDAGWVIDVPRNRLGEAIYTTAEERAILSDTIRSGLKRVVREIISDRVSIKQKSTAALDRILREHSPEYYATKVGELYRLSQ